MSRCAVCNGAGFGGPLSVEEIKVHKNAHQVPASVLSVVDEFWICLDDRCSKIFWEGPKFGVAHQKFRGFFSDKVASSQSKIVAQDAPQDAPQAARGNSQSHRKVLPARS
eukprot:SAG31_NODE_1990_length_6714_cov_43.804384_3_plen_110_part_00